MMRIDSHQHFWVYNDRDYTWMSQEMEEIKRDFLPHHLAVELENLGFDGSIAVQARQTLEETRWLLELSQQWAFIQGVVGWVDLQSPSAQAQLEEFSDHPKFVGVRHVVHDEPDDEFMLRPQFLRGLSQLCRFNLTYDLLLFPKHLPVAEKVVAHFPELMFVVDHIAKPSIKDGIMRPWEQRIRELARYDNVYCKLSGMVTEADWHHWKPEDFYPYLDVVFEAFGADRVMIGSDWPVCTVAGTYQSVMDIVLTYLQRFDTQIQAKVTGENAARFYRIRV